MDKGGDGSHCVWVSAIDGNSDHQHSPGRALVLPARLGSVWRNEPHDFGESDFLR